MPPTALAVAPPADFAGAVPTHSMEIAPLSVPPPGAWPAAAGYPGAWPPVTPPKAKWSKALWVFPALVVLLVFIR